jgi:hypothetical protein
MLLSSCNSNANSSINTSENATDNINNSISTNSSNGITLNSDEQLIFEYIAPDLIPEYQNFGYITSFELAYYKEGETINDAIERLIYNNSKFIAIFIEGLMSADIQITCENEGYYCVDASHLNYKTLDDLIQLFTETYTGGFDSFEKENNLATMPPMFIEENGRLCGRKNVGAFINDIDWSSYNYYYDTIDENTVAVTINALTNQEVIINGEFSYVAEYQEYSFYVVRDTDGIWKLEKLF